MSCHSSHYDFVVLRLPFGPDISLDPAVFSQAHLRDADFSHSSFIIILSSLPFSSKFISSFSLSLLRLSPHRLRRLFLVFYLPLSCVADPHHFNADPAPDLDPAPHQSDSNLRPVVYRLSRVPLEPGRLHCECQLSTALHDSIFNL